MDVTMPDGTVIYGVPDGMSKADLLAKLQRNNYDTEKLLTPPRPGLLGSFMEAATTIPRMGAQATAFAADPNEENRKALLKAGETKYQPVGGFRKENTLGENVEAAKELIGGSVGQAVAPAIVGTGAAIAGAPLGGVGAFVAGPTAGYATNTAQYTIQNLYRQAQEQQDAIDAGKAPNHAAVGKAFVAATGQAGLDLAGQQIFAPLTKAFPFAKNLIFGEGKAAAESAEVLGDAIAKGTLKEVGENTTKLTTRQGYTGNILKGAGKGVVFEVPQEIAQTAIERWQAGLSLTDADAQEEYKQAAIGAAFLGPLFGGASGALETRAKNRETAAEEEKTAENLDGIPPAKGESSYTPPAGVAPEVYAETFARFRERGLNEEDAHDSAVQALAPNTVADELTGDEDTGDISDVGGGPAAGVQGDLGGGVGAPVVRSAREAAGRGVEPVSTSTDVADGGAGPSDVALSDGEVGVRAPATKQAITAAMPVINREFTATIDEFVENKLTPAQRKEAATIYANNIDAGPGAALAQVLTPKPVEQTIVEMAPADQPIATGVLPQKIIPDISEVQAFPPITAGTAPAAPPAAPEVVAEPAPAAPPAAPEVVAEPEAITEPEPAPAPTKPTETYGEVMDKLAAYQAQGVSDEAIVPLQAMIAGYEGNPKPAMTPEQAGAFVDKKVAAYQKTNEAPITQVAPGTAMYGETKQLRVEPEAAPEAAPIPSPEAVVEAPEAAPEAAPKRTPYRVDKRPPAEVWKWFDKAFEGSDFPSTGGFLGDDWAMRLPRNTTSEQYRREAEVRMVAMYGPRPKAVATEETAAPEAAAFIPAPAAGAPKAPKGPKTPKGPKAPKGPTKAQLKAKAAAEKPSSAKAKTDASIDAQMAAEGNLEAATKEGLDEGIGDAVASEDHDPNEFVAQFKDHLEGVNTQFVQASSVALPTSALLDWVGKKVPPLARIIDAVNNMNAERNNLLTAANKLVKKVDAFVSKYGFKEMASAMHIARLSGVNPMAHPDLATALKNDFVRKKYAALLADPNLKPSAKGGFTRAYNQRAKELTETYTAWEALGKQEGGHELYREVRQYYKDMYTALRSRLDKNILAMDISDESKKKLLSFVRLQKEQGKGSLQAEDYPEVDPKEFPDEYFPFKRFGNNWLDVDASLDKAKGRQFYMFDNKAAMLAFRRKLAADAGINVNDPRLKMGFNVSDLHKHMEQNSAMLKEMFAEIEKAFANKQALGPDEKNSLKDALYQVYLMTLPERSVRRQFVHSKNVTGFSADILRTLKTSAAQYSNQLVKLKYAPQVEREVESANTVVYDGERPSDESAKLGIITAEITKRARDQVSPPERGGLTSALNNASFLMFLTSGATAATQFTGIPIRVMPRLLRLYGFKGTVQAMTKWGNLFNSIGVREQQSDGTTKFVFPSAEYADVVKNNPLMKRAFEAGTERGVFGALTDSLIENKATASGPVQNAAQQGLSAIYDMLTGLFNASEKTSREITYMMGFELEFKKAGDFNAAVKAGVDLVNDTLGDYTGIERPSITTANDLARLVFLFKMYAINTTKFFVQNTYAMFKGATPAEKLGAFTELSGVLLMGALFHGMTGMPIYSLVNTAINALSKGEDDEEKRQNFMADSADYRFRYQFMPKHFGQNTFMGQSLADIGTVGLIPAVTGANIGSRTSFDSMWFREGKPGQNWAETVQNTILANIAGASLLPNFVGAIQDFNEGNITRGLEKALPGFFKGAATAYRLKTEGAETRGGDQILNADELADAQLIAQVIGFQPTNLSQTQQQAYAIKKQLETIKTQRRQLMQKLNSELYEDEPDKEKVQKTIEKMMEFNTKYPFPFAQITMDTLDDSWRSYQQKRQYMLRGLSVTKKEAPYVLPDLIRTYKGYEDFGQ
jgi:hypothetical protein